MSGCGRSDRARTITQQERPRQEWWHQDACGTCDRSRSGSGETATTWHTEGAVMAGEVAAVAVAADVTKARVIVSGGSW